MALAIEVLTLVRPLPSGEVLRVVVAEPSLATIGPSESSREELLAYLGERLKDAPPPTLARFAAPPGARLETIEVEIPREDVPRRYAHEAPVAFSAVVVPAGESSWVFVPAIASAIHLGRGEALLDTAAREIARIVSAGEPSPLDHLALLPGPSEALEVLKVELDRATPLHAERRADAEKRREALRVLASIGAPIDAKARPAQHGRAGELATLTAILGGRERLSVAVVGEPRVGKSTLIDAWLQAERRAGRPRLAYATSGAQLIAGMSGHGQWQERLSRALVAAETVDAVLVFEDLAELFGDAGGGPVDLPGFLRPWLDGRARVLGEITPEALQRLEAKEGGFFAQLARVRLEPLGAAEARAALVERAAGRAGENGLRTVVELADRYRPDRPLPERWIGLFEELASRSSSPEALGPEALLDAFSHASGIPAFLLRDDRALYKDALIERLRARIVGQDEAVARVVDLVCVVKAGLQPTGKPLATLLFAGPTGVGKTELARALAELIFGDESRLLRLDMSEYADPLAAERLFGGVTEGLLTRRIRAQPFSVILFDELEKAHASVFDLLLQLTGEGRLTDVRGRTARFGDAIVIFSSNLGATHGGRPLGIGREPQPPGARELAAVEGAFRPELVNRIDRIIPFSPLSPEQIGRVLELSLARLARRRGLAGRGLALDVSPAARALLAARGHHPAYGARALRRELEARVIAPAAQLLAGARVELARGGVLSVRAASEPHARSDGPSLEREGLRVQLVLGADAARASDATAARLSGWRREASRALAHEAVLGAREQLAQLVVQLALDPNDPQRSRDLAGLERARARLAGLLGAVDAPYEALVAAEELALHAYLSDAGPGDLAATAEDASRAFARAAGLLFLHEAPAPDHALLSVKELDDGRLLGHWLAAFASACARRGWSLEVHLAHDPRPDWPGERHYGPPRAIEDVLARLLAREQRSELLARVRGPWCGALLGLEAGAQAFSGRGGRLDPTVLLLRPRSASIDPSDADWRDRLGELPAEPAERRTWVREHRGESALFAGGPLLAPTLDRYFDELERVAYALLVRAGGAQR